MSGTCCGPWIGGNEMRGPLRHCCSKLVSKYLIGVFWRTVSFVRRRLSRLRAPRRYSTRFSRLTLSHQCFELPSIPEELVIALNSPDNNRKFREKLILPTARGDPQQFYRSVSKSAKVVLEPMEALGQKPCQSAGRGND